MCYIAYYQRITDFMTKLQNKSDNFFEKNSQKVCRIKKMPYLCTAIEKIKVLLQCLNSSVG